MSVYVRGALLWGTLLSVLIGCGQGAPSVPSGGRTETGETSEAPAGDADSTSQEDVAGDGTTAGAPNGELAPVSLVGTDVAVPASLDLGLEQASLSGAIGPAGDADWRIERARGAGWNPTFASIELQASAGAAGYARVGIDLRGNNVLHVLTPHSYLRVGEDGDYEVSLSGDRNGDELPADLGTLDLQVLALSGPRSDILSHEQRAHTAELVVLPGEDERQMQAEVTAWFGTAAPITATFLFYPAECSWGS